MKTVPYKNYVILNAYKSKPSDILLLFRIELILRFTKKCFHSIFYFPFFIHLFIIMMHLKCDHFIYAIFSLSSVSFLIMYKIQITQADWWCHKLCRDQSHSRSVVHSMGAIAEIVVKRLATLSYLFMLNGRLCL